MENVNFLDIESSEIEVVSTSFVYPKGTYALRLEKVQQIDGDSMSRFLLSFVIEDVYDIDSTIDITKIVGKKIADSIAIFNNSQEAITESLGKLKFALLQCGANPETKGTLSDLANSAIGQITNHAVFASAGKDGVTRNRIDWAARKQK